MESIQITIGHLEIQYQMALAEVKQYELAAAAWKKVSVHMNSQLNHLVKRYTNTQYTNPEDHVIVYISDE